MDNVPPELLDYICQSTTANQQLAPLVRFRSRLAISLTNQNQRTLFHAEYNDKYMYQLFVDMMVIGGFDKHNKEFAYPFVMLLLTNDRYNRVFCEIMRKEKDMTSHLFSYIKGPRNFHAGSTLPGYLTKIERVQAELTFSMSFNIYVAIVRHDHAQDEYSDGNIYVTQMTPDRQYPLYSIFALLEHDNDDIVIDPYMIKVMGPSWGVKCDEMVNLCRLYPINTGYGGFHQTMYTMQYATPFKKAFDAFASLKIDDPIERRRRLVEAIHRNVNKIRALDEDVEFYDTMIIEMKDILTQDFPIDTPFSGNKRWWDDSDSDNGSDYWDTDSDDPNKWGSYNDESDSSDIDITTL